MTHRGVGRSDARNQAIVVVPDRLLRDTLSLALRGEGWNVAEAGSALAALERPERLDLIVSKLELPDMQGVDLAGRLLVRNPEMMVLFVSGSGRPTPAGFAPDNLLSMPFGLADLSRRVEVLRRQMAR